MKKREINIDEFTSKDIEDLKKENIDLRVQNNKLLNDNFLLASMHTNLNIEVMELKEAILLLNDWFEMQVVERTFPLECSVLKYEVSFKSKLDKSQGMFFLINKVPVAIRKLMMQDGNND